MKSEKSFPPQIFLRFFRWYCHPKLVDHIEGDLLEDYGVRIGKSGKRKADIRFIIDVLLLLRPNIIRPAEGYQNLNNYGMFNSYFKIGWRNLLRNKGYSLINIGGLALGMAVAMLIGLWVYDEVSYNRSHLNYGHIAQVYRRNTEPLGQKTYSSSGLPQPVAKVLTEKYDHLFKHVALLWWDADYTLRVGEDNFIKRGQFIDKSVIDMFSLKMIYGTPKSLDNQQAIIISQSTARSLFGDNNPINQFIKLNATMDFTVTGVYVDIAPNSLFGHIEFFGNFEGLKANYTSIKTNEDNWGNTGSRILVQTADNIPIAQANAAIAELYLKDGPDDVVQYSKKHNTNVWLHPMKDWYLYSEFKNGYPIGGRVTFVWLFAIVGVFVLLLACINFMNLSTARNEKRAKEVGIRKAVGSMRSQLVNQFLSESFLVVFMALVISLLLVSLSIPTFNNLADKSIVLPFANIYFWVSSFIFLIITSLLAGLYPAFYLSSLQPVKVLKGTLRLGRYAALPRKMLVIIQVTVSVVLIIGTMIVYQQILYTQNRPVGYDREGLIRIPIHDSDFSKTILVLKEELLASGAAREVGFSSSPLTAIWDNWGGFTWRGKNPESESSFAVTWVDEDYGKTVQWKVLKGRDFSRSFGTDADAVIINKSAAMYIGLENPVGEFITFSKNNQQRKIIAVVDDVIAESPYEQVRPAFYWLESKNQENLGQMFIKLNTGMSEKDALVKIESIQKTLLPTYPFDYSFVDEEYDRKFKAEQRIGKLAAMFATLAIFISCLGLFGLSSFLAEQKTKEIGIRKVIGATLFNIWGLLSREFIVLVLISFVMAIPVSYYYLNQWLLMYTYHTEINPLVFVYAGGGTLAITLITVSFHSVRAGIANPVKSLRSE